MFSQSATVCNKHAKEYLSARIVPKNTWVQESCQCLPYAIPMPTSRHWGKLEGRGRADAVCYYCSTCSYTK